MTVERKGICRKIELKLPKLTIQVNSLTINLGKRDVVVGIPWLYSTGLMGDTRIKVPCNYEEGSAHYD